MRKNSLVLTGGAWLSEEHRLFEARPKNAVQGRKCFGLAAVLVLSLLSTMLGHAQSTSGTIVGNVTDQSGAVLPGLPVVLTNIATSDTRETVTNQSGFYQFVNTTPGTYRISAEKPGFKKITREPINLQVSTTIQVDLAMEIGSVGQQVVVNSATPLIEAETTSLGAVVDQRETNEIPLNGRNAMSLAALVPSVIPQGQSMQNPNGTNPFAQGNYQIGGGLANQSASYLDGAPLNIEYGNMIVLVPTQDSLDEFKVDTNVLSAEYGRLAGGAINFRTKSGTSELHGNAWEYIRNKVVNANTYFGNQAGLANPAFTQNQYGFNVGGPVRIPHVYDGHNKTFFFVNWEGFALRQGQTFTETVPTAAERGGDLSALGVPIYDPLTTCGVAGYPACNGVPQYTRSLFPNAVIPSNRLNPTSVAYLQAFYPQPNIPGSSGQNNFTTNASVGGNNYQTVVHIDQTLSERQHLSARYTHYSNDNLAVNPYNNGICSDRCTELFDLNNFVIDDNYTFNPTTILDLRLSYLRFDYVRTPVASTFSLASIGQPADLAAQVQFPGPPATNISGFDDTGIFSSAGGDSTINTHTDDYRIAGTLSKFLGNHTIKVGGEFRRDLYNNVQNNTSSGNYTFNNGFTAQNPLTSVGGAGLASFLLGYPNSGNITYATPISGQQLYPALFVTDDWRSTRQLTFHLGLRWENTGPWTERHNRISYFDPTMANPIVSNYRGAVGLVASPTRSSRGSVNNDLTQFSPRVGLSYQFAPNTVISLGYGVMWLPNDINQDLEPNQDAINLSNTPFTASTNGFLTPANTFNNPFPQGIVLPVNRNPNFQQTLLGTSINEAYVNSPFGYAQQWNVEVQQQLGNQAVLDISYGGAKGTHLSFSQLQRNQLPDGDLALGNQLLQQVPNPFYGIISSAYSLGAATVPAGQLLLPFPEYNSVYDVSGTLGASTYNSLQVKLQKRFSGGASFNFAYTFAKLLSNTDTLTNWLEPSSPGGVQDSYDLQAEKSLSAQDARQRFVTSYVYDLPFGRGRKFLANPSSLIEYTAGGWSLEGVTTLMSGFPLSFRTNVNLTNSFGGGSRPNYTAGCSKATSGSAVSRLNSWFNTSCFTQPSPFTFGNEPRTDPQVRAPGVADWDSAVVKKFPIARDGKVNVQFRAEVYNLFNRVQFGYPGETQGTANFGIVGSQQNLPRILQFALRVGF
jgi:hypothetical protein